MNDLIVTASPHIRAKHSVSSVMRDVVIALAPAGVASVIFFGWYALLIIAASVIAAVASEAILQKLLKKKVTVNDYSAIVTGLLVAYNVPPTVPLWIPIIGSAFAIIIVKQLFGGLGHNFMNPALTARAVLLACWPVIMTTFAAPNVMGGGVDAIASATPLAMLKTGAVDALPRVWDMYVGNIPGCLGETSKVALLIGAIYLFYREVISWRIPVTFVATVALLTFVLGAGFLPEYLLSGGLILGAFFMATDYASSPTTYLGQIIMGVGCGVFTTIIRLYGGYPEGVSYSILIMNTAAPLIEKYTKPRVYGVVKKSA